VIWVVKESMTLSSEGSRVKHCCRFDLKQQKRKTWHQRLNFPIRIPLTLVTFIVIRARVEVIPRKTVLMWKQVLLTKDGYMITSPNTNDSIEKICKALHYTVEAQTPMNSDGGDGVHLMVRTLQWHVMIPLLLRKSSDKLCYNPFATSRTV
jgi:hypothetical protein